MKRFLLRGGMVAAAVLLGGLFAPHAKGTSPRREAALVEFKDRVVLLDVVLKGEYLVVHDEDRMAQGEPCTHVYKRRAGRSYERIVSFRCRPVGREKAELFTTSVSRAFGGDLYRVDEIQFAGSIEGHKVP